MNTKRKGSRNEHRSIKLLEGAGYAVTRAAASLGVFDLIGVGTVDFVLVQVKSNRWPSSEETASIKAFICPPNARKLVHRWRDRQPQPDIKEL
jgi:Holliday junction resolvase